MFSIICLIHFVWMKNHYYLTKKADQIKLPNWVNVRKDRFHEILSKITKAKSDVLKTNVDGREITQVNAESLLNGIGTVKINGSEFKRKNNNIVNDVEAIRRSQFSQEVKKKSKDEQPATTDMSE